MDKGKPTVIALTFHSKFKLFGDHSVKSSSILIFIMFLVSFRCRVHTSQQKQESLKIFQN